MYLCKLPFKGSLSKTNYLSLMSSVMWPIPPKLSLTKRQASLCLDSGTFLEQVQVLNISQQFSETESVVGPKSSNIHINSLQVPASPQNSDLDSETLRSRSSSFISYASTTRSRVASHASIPSARFEGDDLTSEEMFRPDKSAESDFEVANNPFALSPGLLNELFNPRKPCSI